MICSSCGQLVPDGLGRCTSCSAILPYTSVLVAMVPEDTTGLPSMAADLSASISFTGEVTTVNGTTTVTVRHADAVTGPLNVGEAFGPRYHIIRVLGIGGMGAVYQAWDSELNAAVALKVIRSDKQRRPSREAEDRFKEELKLARQVTHKNVVRIHDLGEIGGIKYITMPYVQGENLTATLRKGKIPVVSALRLARQIAAGLEAAHDAGVVHRDLKPANIMISGSGASSGGSPGSASSGSADERRAVIMDFGISASVDQVTTGLVVGTLEYMAPEQAKGQAPDARADIYAFGLILYEMLTGLHQRASKNVAERIEAMQKRFLEGMPPLRALDASLPEALDNLISTCVANDPSSRYANGKELCEALAALDENGELLPVLARFRKRTLVGAALLVVMLLLGTFVVTSILFRPPAKIPIVSVLVADFDNRSGDTALDGPIGAQALSFALEGAPYVALYPAKDARALAVQFSKDHTDRLTEETGILIARREGIQVIVGGVIEKNGNGYRLTAQAIDPVSDKTIKSESANAANRAGALRAIDTLAGRVRVALGESKTEMDKVYGAETFTAGSLEAMQAYSRAQDLANTGKVQEALAAYQEAIHYDPQMGRAYSGTAIIYRNLGQMDKAEATFKEALKYVDRMSEREKYRTLGAFYFSIARNYPKAVETYESLIAKYPTDQASLANLAFAYATERNFTRAVEISRQLVDIYPKNVLARTNYASYALYAGNYDEAIAQTGEVFKQNASYQFAFLPLALAQFSKGDSVGGLKTYAQLEKLNAFGASLVPLGTADFAAYHGRYGEAAATLTTAAAADEHAGNKSGAAAKYLALSEAHLILGRRDPAVAAARKATALSSEASVMFPAALTFIGAGRLEAATAIADKFRSGLEDEPRSYARLIDAEIARVQRRVPAAIDAAREAQKRHDSWWSRLILGRLYEELDQPHHEEALAELEAAVKRRGEAADAFIADTPTLRYVPPAYYWLGRAQEGMQATAAARRSYEQFLDFRRTADVNDPLVADARARVASLAR
jgi:tetratricopeptide (TPR) repeat protein